MNLAATIVCTLYLVILTAVVTVMAAAAMFGLDHVLPFILNWRV